VTGMKRLMFFYKILTMIISFRMSHNLEFVHRPLIKINMKIPCLEDRILLHSQDLVQGKCLIEKAILNIEVMLTLYRPGHAFRAPGV
jgi:hypothetical protein